MTTDLNDHSSRAHALLSASYSHRWIACPYSATISAKYPAQDTPFTREGTVAHEVAEAIASGRVEPENVETGFDVHGNPLDVTPEMVRHAEAYRDYIKSLCNDRTLMLLEQRVNFSEWVKDGFGTADCILLFGDTMDVIDYKYGQGVAVSAVDNPQMMLYGLGAVHEYGFAYDIEKVRLHIFQPRISNISVYETTMEQLLAWGEVIVKPAADKAYSGLVEMHGGEHCRFCPHAGQCPELAKYCGAITIMSQSKAPDTLPPEDISRVLALEPIITNWLKKVKEVAMYRIENGAEVPGYKIVEGKMGNRKWEDDFRVAEILRSNGYMDEDFTITKVMSPSELDKAIGKKRVSELLDTEIVRSLGSPTLVPESDKRPRLDRLAQAQDDFK